jgi:hypothetical protein
MNAHSQAPHQACSRDTKALELEDADPPRSILFGVNWLNSLRKILVLDRKPLCRC